MDVQEESGIAGATDKEAEKVKKAAEIVEFLGTPVGMRIREKIAELHKGFAWAPEDIVRFHQVAIGENGAPMPFLEPDTHRLSMLIGARQSLDVILNWFFEMEKIVAKAAEERSKKDRKEPPGTPLP